MLSSEVRRLKESEGGMQAIKKMISKGYSKEFILDLDYTEEEYAEAESELGQKKYNL